MHQGIRQYNGAAKQKDGISTETLLIALLL